MTNAIAKRTPLALRPGAIMVADVSSSMAARDNPLSPLRRIDHLAAVMGQILSRVRLQRFLCFSSTVVEIPLEGHISLPEPSGSTALEFPFLYIQSEVTPPPARIIVLCDGEPNNEDRALDAAAMLAPIPIDAYFVGNDRDHRAIDFMRRLSAAGGPGGRTGRFDLAKTDLLANEVVLAITDQRRR